MVTSINLDGLHKLEFGSNLNFRGSGLVMLKDGKFKGNDHSYEWHGVYEVKDGILHAEMTVKKFSGGVSIFGTIADFSLVLSGPVEQPRMTLKGYRKEDPEDKIVVIMTRHSEDEDAH